MNTLCYGDNLDILRRKLRDDTVDLFYIDPPFNSKRNYFQIYNNIGKDDAAQTQAFIDTWTWNELSVAGFQEIITNYEGRYTRQTIELLKGLKAVLGDSELLSYLVSMTQRVNEIQRVLKPTGSFYLHCDPTSSHYLKLVLDSVFCARGGDYLNEITWKRGPVKGGKVTSRQYGRIADIIFLYSKTKDYIFIQSYKPYDLDSKYNKFIHKDANGRIYSRDNPLGNYSEESIKKFEQEGRIYVTRNGKKQLIRYLDEVKGLAIGCVWDDIYEINQVANERLGYPTQKPEALLERIIQASSNEGDTVLDAYCGCGTTVAVAQRLRRNWIGIDITYQSIAVILKRLEDSFGADIMNTVTFDGIPSDMESAYALANKRDDRVRKEFEKWALLTYSKNRATINEKKGADKGIDGIAYIITSSDTTARVIFQVKSGKVKRNDIATLNSARQREDAVMAILITLEESTKPMRDEALAVGSYHHELLNRDYPIIQIVTIQEMIEENKRIDLPLNIAVLKAAKAAVADEQKGLL